MEVEKHHVYKSPITALLWSVMMCGFGQYYNGQYIFGTVLLLCEVGANVLSRLNVSILHSFHGDYQMANDIINYQWGLFYPSIYGFSIWQAYNKAKIISHQREGNELPKKTYLTGFCLGLVVGMNVGIIWKLPSLLTLFF